MNQLTNEQIAHLTNEIFNQLTNLPINQSTNYNFLCKTNPILSAVGGLQMNVTSFITKYYENKWQRRVRKNKPNTNPKQSQFQTRSEFIPKGAEITTGELLGILKPGTNQTQSPACS